MASAEVRRGRSGCLWLVAATAVLAVVVVVCGEDALEYVARRTLCGATVRKSVAAPDGAYTAVVFDRNCGVGSDPHTKVAVVAGGSEFDEMEYPEFLTIEDDYVFDLTMVWTGPAALSITMPPGARTRYDPDKARGVRVTLQEEDASGDGSRLAE